MHKDLIFDVGMHNGLDSEYYLRKGFRVVAIEANPQIAEKTGARLKSWVDSGQLIIRNIGIADKAGTLDFYYNKTDDLWSSFMEIHGTKGGKYEIGQIECVPLLDLLDEYGTPYYLKIDIEGHDDFAIASLEQSKHRPKYVSVECTVTRFPLRMSMMGYDAFKLISQVWHQYVPTPNPPKEGRYTDMRISGHMTGPFGEETYGEWMTVDEFRTEMYMMLDKKHTEMAQHLRFGVPLDVMQKSWWDFHARLAE